MNSADLQREFPKVYSDFFHTHDIVISGDGILTWWPDISHGVSVLRIKQKLPLKTFCGVCPNNSGKITFRTLYVYDILLHTFREKSFSESFQDSLDNLALFLERYLHDQGFVWGIEFDFLSEAPPWHGFAFSAVCSVLLTYVVYIISWKLDPSDFEQGELREDHPLFEELYIFSLTLSHYISWEKSIGGWSNYAVMLGRSISPIVYFSAKNPVSSKDEYERDGSRDFLQHVRTDMTLYKDTLEHFLGISSIIPWEFPLDYGILFMGVEYRFWETEKARLWIHDEGRERSLLIRNIIGWLLIGEEKKMRLIELLGFEQNTPTYPHIDDLNLRILEAFSILLTHSHNGDSADKYIEIFQQIGLSSFSYQKENTFFFDLIHYFHKFQQFRDEKIAILPFNTGKMGWSLLFVMKKWYSRATFEKTLDQMRLDGQEASLYHASWRDGYAKDGIRLEQYISKEYYSSHTKKGDVYYRDSHGNAYCGDYDMIVKNQTEGILLDEIGWRIYVQGEKLTSRDIHSQNTTIDMLKLLLMNLWEEVPNTKLPLSTYSQNKNELLGKVVLPIKKIVKKYFLDELSLSCTGGITEYYLRLQKDEHIVIGLIQRL